MLRESPNTGYRYFRTHLDKQICFQRDKFSDSCSIILVCCFTKDLRPNLVFEMKISLRFRLKHTHTHTYIYIYTSTAGKCLIYVNRTPLRGSFSIRVQQSAQIK